VLADTAPVLVHNCGGSRPRHDETCECTHGDLDPKSVGYHPRAGDVVVLGKREVGIPLAERLKGHHFNGDPYGKIGRSGKAQWAEEVGNALSNPNILIAVDLGKLAPGGMTDPREIFLASAKRGIGKWNEVPGTDWEMRQIQIKAGIEEYNMAARITWFMNGEVISSRMLGILG
jgi:hypothetical protein